MVEFSLFSIFRRLGYNIQYNSLCRAKQTIISGNMSWVKYATHRKRCIHAHCECFM